jgi:DNA-binding NarL/FixJ family response regulator
MSRALPVIPANENHSLNNRVVRSSMSSNVTPTPGPSVQIRVLLADDSGVMLDAVSRLLTVAPEVELVGAAGNFEEVVRLADALQPQIVILDLRMAQKANADALRLKSQQIGLRLLAITASNIADDESIALASAIGADKLLDKMNLTNELVPAILELAAKSE